MYVLIVVWPQRVLEVKVFCKTANMTDLDLAFFELEGIRRVPTCFLLL
jgi:hypothetical protein